MDIYHVKVTGVTDHPKTLQSCIDVIREERVKHPIVTLIGSSHFQEEFVHFHHAFAKAGFCVFVPGVAPNKEHSSPEERKILDGAYKKEIEISDAVFVINKGGYIGLATCDKIMWAIACNKPISFCSPLDDQDRDDLIELMRRESKN